MEREELIFFKGVNVVAQGAANQLSDNSYLATSCSGLLRTVKRDGTEREVRGGEMLPQ